MKQYIILSGSMDELEALVNDAYSKGYIAHGDLLLSPQGGYIQAMTYTRSNELPTTTKTTKK
jgi:hypothetical protein